LKQTLLKIAGWAAHALPSPIKKALYRVPPLARMIRRSLNVAAPAGITQVQVAAGLLAGMTMALNMQTEKDYWLGTYEPDLQDALRKFVQPGMTVYDLGANIGYISLMAAHLAGPTGRVVAFEALPANVARLEQNIRLNHMEGRVRICSAAVVDSSAPVTFLAHESGAMGKAVGSAGRDAQYPDSIQVRGVALDDFVFGEGNPAPHLIKTDIEGGEGPALVGMRRLLKEVKPVLLIELHGEVAARQVWQSLHSAGYTFLRMGKGYPLLRNVEELGWKSYVVALPAK